MKASFAFSTLSLLLLFAGTFGARKDMGEYWKADVKDQSIPESIEISLVREDPTSYKKEKLCVKNFEPRPDASIYHNNIRLPTERKAFLRDFEPRPDASIYVNDIKPNQKKAFVSDFERRPDATIYVNSVESTEEQRPDATIYHG